MNKGILYMILSGLSFFVVNFFVKILGTQDNHFLFDGLQHYPAHELVLARSIVSFSISLAIIKYRKIPVFGNNKKWLLVRAISGTLALTLFFNTIHYLPFAIATTIQYLAPIFTVLFAMILLKEKVKQLQWLFIVLSFIGVSLIALDRSFAIKTNEYDISFLWLGLGILSSVFSGIAYTAIMKLRTTDSPITIVFYFPMIAIPLMTLMCLFDFTFPNGIEWLILLIIGIFTQIAQILLTKALHLGSASTITPFQYLGAIYTFLAGYLVFGETLSILVDIGILLAVSGVIVNAILRRR